jgi:hypothetical protein
MLLGTLKGKHVPKVKDDRSLMIHNLTCDSQSFTFQSMFDL